MEEVMGFDVYNMAQTGEVSKTLNAKRDDADHTPVVAIRGGGGGYAMSVSAKQQSLAVGEQMAASVGANDYKEPQVVCIHPSVANTITRRAEGSPNPDKRQGANVVVVSLDPLNSNSMKSSNPNSGSHIAEVAKCIDTTNPDPTKNQGGMVVCLTPWDNQRDRIHDADGGISPTIMHSETGGCVQPAVLHVACYPLDADKLKPSNNTEECFMRGERKGGNGFGVGKDGDPAYTVNTVDRHGVAVAYGTVYEGGGFNIVCRKELADALSVKHQCAVILAPCIVRRLLPVETERLMAFPDGHTAPRFTAERIAELTPFFIEKFAEWDVINGKDPAKVKRKTPAQIAKWLGAMGTPDQPDAPRYKACGNSMCCNCMEWIGRRIDMVDKEDNQ